MRKTFKAIAILLAVTSIAAPSIVARAEQSASQTLYVKWDTVKVRAARSKKSAVVKKILRNRKVTALSSFDAIGKNDWVKIRTKSGNIGFVLKKQLSAKSEQERVLAACRADYATIVERGEALGWTATGEYECSEYMHSWDREDPKRPRYRARHIVHLEKDGYDISITHYAYIDYYSVTGQMRSNIGWLIQDPNFNTIDKTEILGEDPKKRTIDALFRAIKRLGL